MADAITIPSPSVFLRASPPPSPRAPDKSSSAVSKNDRRSAPLQGSKKKAPARKSTATPVNDGPIDAAVVKPKQSKSRNGCLTCKAKRLKCDEEKPTCQQCARRNVECGGYKKDFKWRPFEDSNVKINIDRQKRGNSPPRPSSSDPLRPSSPLIKKPSNKTESPARSNLETNVLGHGRTDSNGSPLQTALPERPMTLRREASYQSQDSDTVTPVDEISDPMALSLIHHDELPPVSAPGFEVHRHDFYPGALSHLTPGLGLSPTLTESLWPFNSEDPMHQDFVNYELSESFRNPTAEDESEPPDMDKDPIDYISGSSGAMGGLSLTSTAGLLTPTESSIEDPSEENARGLLGYIYPQPFLAEDSSDMLTYRFDKLTCGILSIMDGPGDNPWRTIMWPMAIQSPALYHAINAMSAYHSAWDIPQFRVLGHEHKNASIRFIQEGIRDNSFSVHTAIATALCLGLAEAWDRHSNTGNTHIKGAQVLVKQALKEHQQRRLEGIELARLKFLCNAWVYMDVMARITTFENDESHDFDNTFLFSGDPDEFPRLITGDTHPGFGIDFGIPVDSRLDPLMGCASTLFPLIGRTANLVRKLVKTDTNSPAIITVANDIKMGLERWDPPNEIDDPEDPDTSVQHTLQTAEAYRWATLLYLHQAVPELPSLSSTELAQRVLQYIATVPLTSRTIIVQTYPLMIAGCEAKTNEDRQWVLNRWEAMIGLMRLGMTQKAQLVMEEVWRRRDAWQANPGANRRLVPTSVVQPQRPRSRPFARSPSGDVRYGEIGDPGRTGMVFSYVEVDDNDTMPGNRPKSPKDEKRERRAMERRDGRDPRMELQDPAYTVRGHLHWIGVMWNWGWEILLG